MVLWLLDVPYFSIANLLSEMGFCEQNGAGAAYFNNAIRTYTRQTNRINGKAKLATFDGLLI